MTLEDSTPEFSACIRQVAQQCIEACEGERVSEVDETDFAYNAAITHCIEAITARFGLEKS